ncbi:zinc finger protein 728-like isoform X2 [Toxorhynchites rutilus septentrionalis]|uniref:zinc finger protein 728-like isoform X2 n=1 Tax=Toxorhynchites rutilus septentrionalis TaxID=329112 RepID=UPI002479DC9F|nr:zinc finger protein 728-like isoform X2 [Toxorhynchites rutilus septentrionalis]
MTYTIITSDTVLCRLCLADDGVMCPLFGSQPYNLVEKIYECTSLKIEQIKGVPFSICEVCKSKLIICSQFIKQCLKTDREVRKLFAQCFERHESSQQKPDQSERKNEEIDCVLSRDESPSELAKPIDDPDSEEVFLIEIVEQSQSDEEQEKQICNYELDSPIVEEHLVENGENGDTLEENQAERSEQLSEKDEKSRKSQIVDINTKSCNENEKPSVTSVKRERKSKRNTRKSKVICETATTALENETQPKESSKGKLTENARNGAKKYTKECPICGVPQQNLNQHMTVHLGTKKYVWNKPYKCDQCDKCFGDPTALKSHKIIHSNEANFRCDICQNTFKYRHSLKSHIRSHNDDRRHSCTYCEMAFVTSSGLKKHIRRHTGERPYKCKHCSKAFTAAGNLQIHQKTHTRERPFQCAICESRFGYKAVLKQHMKIHMSKQDGKRCDKNNTNV